MRIDHKYVAALFLSFFLVISNSSAQSIVSKLNTYFQVLRSYSSNSEKAQASDSIALMLNTYLITNDSLIPNSLVANLGNIRSKDNKLTIYTWNYQQQNLAYKYGCVIQFKDKDKTYVSVLEDTRNDIPLNKTLSKNEWYGCLYYAIITKTKRKKTYYTLLGWDGNNTIIARKIIDVLTFLPKGEPELGESIFKLKAKTQKRVVFQFSASGSMMLNYDERYKRILFDHLSPAQPEYEGKFEFYGSDFSYDGFKFQRNKWVFQEMLDPRNED